MAARDNNTWKIFFEYPRNKTSYDVTVFIILFQITNKNDLSPYFCTILLCCIRKSVDFYRHWFMYFTQLEIVRNFETTIMFYYCRAHRVFMRLNVCYTLCYLESSEHSILSIREQEINKNYFYSFQKYVNILSQ